MPSETPEGRDAEQAARRQFERFQFELYQADRSGRDFIQQDRARREAAAAALDALPPPPRPPPPKIEISETVFEPMKKGGEVTVTPPPGSSDGALNLPPYVLTTVAICDMTNPDTPTARLATLLELPP